MNSSAWLIVLPLCLELEHYLTYISIERDDHRVMGTNESCAGRFITKEEAFVLACAKHDGLGVSLII